MVMDPHVSYDVESREHFQCTKVKMIKLSKVDISLGLAFLVDSKKDLDDMLEEMAIRAITHGENRLFSVI